MFRVLILISDNRAVSRATCTVSYYCSLEYNLFYLICLCRHSANPRLKNKAGLNPCELAIKLNHDEIVTCFATYVGAGLLEKISYQPSLTL